MKKITLLMLFFMMILSLYSQSYLEYSGCGVVRAVISKSIKQEFLKTHPDCQIDIVGKGDQVGLREATSGISDLGGTCRHKIDVPEEKYAHLTAFAWDGIAVVVNKDNPLKNITSEQLKQVLTGEITMWKDLNGENAPINLYIRQGKNSGVGRMTRELLFADPNVEYSSKANIFFSTTPLETGLEKDRYGFAVTGVYSARKRKGLKIIKLDGVSLTNENIRSNKYPLIRPLYLVYDFDDTTQEAEDFINLILSDKGQTLLRQDGVVVMSDAMNLWKPFEKKMKKAGQNIKLLR